MVACRIELTSGRQDHRPYPVTAITEFVQGKPAE